MNGSCKVIGISQFFISKASIEFIVIKNFVFFAENIAKGNRFDLALKGFILDIFLFIFTMIEA